MSASAILRSAFVQEGLKVAVIMGTGDVIAQTFIEKRKMSDINVKRVLKFAGIGMFFVGPALRAWYGKLDKFISPNQKPIIRGLKKMAFDQFVFAPIFCAALIVVFDKLNQEPNDRIVKRFKNDYPTIMLRNYMLWPMAQIINFSFVPLSYQVIYAQFIAIIWNTYLAMALNKK